MTAEPSSGAGMLPEPPGTEADLRMSRARLRSITTARILLDRAGLSYPTRVLLELRAQHATARDAVASRVDLASPAWESLLARGLFEVRSPVRSHEQHLLQPALGRRLDDDSRQVLTSRAGAQAAVQIVLGDGLSADALTAQAPPLVEALVPRFASLGWSVATPFFVRHCRVGIMNDVGSLLTPEFVVLLIGERPGLGGALSLSAYLAYRPSVGDTDAQRNLISNIHDSGVPTGRAADRIVALLASMRQHGRSGVTIKEGRTDGGPTAAARPLGPGSPST